jgi:hypothetical protein
MIAQRLAATQKSFFQRTYCVQESHFTELENRTSIPALLQRWGVLSFSTVGCIFLFCKNEFDFKFIYKSRHELVRNVSQPHPSRKVLSGKRIFAEDQNPFGNVQIA